MQAEGLLGRFYLRSNLYIYGPDPAYTLPVQATIQVLSSPEYKIPTPRPAGLRNRVLIRALLVE